MNQTQKLLQSVVENARTGLDAVEQLLRQVKDARMREELMVEREQYQGFIRDAEQALYAAGGQPHAKGMMERMGMWMGIRMNTMTDVSNPHIAEMLIQGLTMGIVGMTKDRNDLPEADANAQGIASNFITTQQDAIDRLKPLLKQEEKQGAVQR